MAEKYENEEPLLSVEDDSVQVHIERPLKQSSQVDTGRCAQENIELRSLDGKAGVGDPSEQESLLQTVETQRYETVKRRVTALALMNCGENPLLLAIKVIEKLRERVAREEPDSDDFNVLTNQVEEFTLRFLDPLKYESLRIRRFFSLNPNLNTILETAIKLDQKKFFDHPIVEGIMSERWFTSMGRGWKLSRPWLWFFLNMWCLFDIVLFPLSFSLAVFLDWILSHVKFLFNARFHLIRLGTGTSPASPMGFKHLYKRYFTIPYFIYVRDTMSYLALLALHIQICLQRSHLSLSRLECAIFVFLFGRLLMETKETVKMTLSEVWAMKIKLFKNYIRDTWNLFDVLTLIIFFCAIIPLRISTWLLSESATQSRLLEVVGHLYGVNAMLLTTRAFGSFLEGFEGAGTIQIALFNIIREAVVVVVHLFVITLAFSIAMMKVFLESAVDETEAKNYTWLSTFKQLGFALVELSDGLNTFKVSQPFAQETVNILFAVYLAIALILVVNMLIALLSNTYQRVQDNSRKEWAFKKAVTIQTYSEYHPIPVPFNIISMFLMKFPCFRMKEISGTLVTEDQWKKRLDNTVSLLQAKYRLKYGDSFPPTESLYQMIEDVNDTESMVDQILHKTFTSQRTAFLPTGPEAWDAHPKTFVAGCQITCQSHNPALYANQRYFSCYGARYKTNFSPRFPHFEVMVLGNADKGRVSLGVVDSSHNHGLAPGLGGSVGFNTDLRIFDSEKQTSSDGKRVTGVARVRRGDVIRCTVMFEHQQERGGAVQIPVAFFVNGIKMVPEGGQTLIKHNGDKPWYPYVGFDHQNSALAKMGAREDVDYRKVDLEDVKLELTEAKSELNLLKSELTEAKSEITKTKTELVETKFEMVEVKSELHEVKSQLRDATRTLGDKLDALLRKVGEKENE